MAADWDDRVKELLELKPGWDSYGAKKIDKRYTSLALGLIDGLQLLPLNNGGVVVSSYTSNFDLEIELGPDGTCTTWWVKGRKPEKKPAQKKKAKR